MNKSRHQGHRNKENHYKNKINDNNAQRQNLQNSSYNHVLQDPQDYMFTQKNILLFTKHVFKNMETQVKKKEIVQVQSQSVAKFIPTNRTPLADNFYRPKQKDSLFWCLYILKHGLSEYEMNVGNQHFVVEKKEKINYVQLLRNQQQKDMLKLHKIKPISEVEFDLTNNEKISVKTFFALCVMENINVLLLDKRKKYELQMNDGPIYVIHRNGESLEHRIEFDVTSEKLQDYRDNYYNMETFESKLKCISYYKVADLMELCRKLNVEIKTDEKKKMTKKDIYEKIQQEL